MTTDISLKSREGAQILRAVATQLKLNDNQSFPITPLSPEFFAMIAAAHADVDTTFQPKSK